MAGACGRANVGLGVREIMVRLCAWSAAVVGVRACYGSSNLDRTAALKRCIPIRLGGLAGLAGSAGPFFLFPFLFCFSLFFFSVFFLNSI